MKHTPLKVRPPRLAARAALLAALGMSIVVLAASPASASDLALAPGDPSPSMTAWDLDGKLETIEWEGLTLFNFWATWCEACRLEMPELEKLQETYGPKGLRIFGMNRESMPAQQIREFVTEAGVSYSQMKPDKRLAKGWAGINVLPTSYLIDAEGKILRKYVGASPEQIEGMRDDIDNLLNGLPMGPLVIVKPEVVQKKNY